MVCMIMFVLTIPIYTLAKYEIPISYGSKLIANDRFKYLISVALTFDLTSKSLA